MDNAEERDGGQDGYGHAPVSRRSFVVGVAAAGAAATAGRALPGRRALPVVAGTGRARRCRLDVWFVEPGEEARLGW